VARADGAAHLRPLATRWISARGPSTSREGWDERRLKFLPRTARSDAGSAIKFIDPAEILAGNGPAQEWQWQEGSKILTTS